MAKTKALISFAVTAKQICVFVFAYADCWFSHATAHITYINDHYMIFTYKEQWPINEILSFLHLNVNVYFLFPRYLYSSQ